MKTLHLSIIAILLISAILFFNEASAQNMTNSTNQIPPGAIRTPNGGWIMPIQTTTQNGSKLTIHYEIGIPVPGKYLTPGPPPDPVFLTDSRGNIDNFITHHQILIRADTWKRTPDTKTTDIAIRSEEHTS